MAAPVVAGVNSGGETADTTTHTITYDTSPSSGNLLIIQVVIDGNPTVTGPSGFSTLYDAAHSGSAFRTACWYKQATGSEGTSITFSTGSSEQSRYAVWRITGHENPSTQAPQIQSADSPSNGTTPDPPSISPTGGSKDYLIIPFFGADTGNMTISAFPYTNNNISQSGSTTGAGVTLGACNDAVTAASIDPTSFTISASRPWTAHTIAVHPAGAGGVTDQVPSGTLTLSGIAPKRIKRIYEKIPAHGT